jgi:hypothetical protein
MHFEIETRRNRILKKRKGGNSKEACEEEFKCYEKGLYGMMCSKTPISFEHTLVMCNVAPTLTKSVEVIPTKFRIRRKSGILNYLPTIPNHE